jgi:hypothetical protein
MAFLLVCVVCVCVFLFIINEENSVREDNFLERAKIFFPAYFFMRMVEKSIARKTKERDTETSIQTVPISRTTRHTRRV